MTAKRRVVPLGLIVVLAVPALQACSADTGRSASGAAASANQSVELSAQQLRFVAIAQATERTFTLDRDTVGVVDFDEDLTVQVSPPYQGRIVELRARAGDRVRRGQVLFTIDSPDLLQAESTLISAAATLDLSSKALQRAKGLYAIKGMAQKDYEQAISAQQTAEGAYQAARDAVRIFGKSDAQIDRIVAQRRVDARMPVPSPIDGVVTARNAAPGTLVQPGASPAPYAVADLRTKWLLAEVPEDEVPSLRLGQSVDVRLSALPGRTFQGRISYIAEALDANTRRASVRSEVRDPNNELRPQMFATFTLHMGDATRSVSVPYDA
ncbi:MAG TPA: efflux RND transporter periplasmic adaptor subunit, partial [Steroidobacteraceae bacterium]|nr:efflux RND transporter periplasmic adaptor subunit [Steroidobacteraceae bacterium]